MYATLCKPGMYASIIVSSASGANAGRANAGRSCQAGANAGRKAITPDGGNNLLEPPPAKAVEMARRQQQHNGLPCVLEFVAMPAGLVGPRYSGLLDPPYRGKFHEN